MKCHPSSLLLYAVTDRTWLGDHTLAQDVEACLRGGATMVQLREKSLPFGAFAEEGRIVRALCKRYSVPFIVNDDVDVALACDADGVHVGQSDMAAGNVRARIGGSKMLGVSAQTVGQAVLAQRQGADYLGVGAVFPTGTKQDADFVPYATLKEICAAVSIPVVAIGGICARNAMELSGSGIAGISVISALFAAKDIEAAARELLELSRQVAAK